MIEIVTSKSGQPVVRRDGRLLASRFEPATEAAAWLERRRTLLDNVRTVFVLGLGAGYHVRALTEQTTARVHVLEPDAELIEVVRELHDFPARTLIEHVDSARELRASKTVRESLKESFIVLEYAPGRHGFESWFKEASVQLVAREWGALTWQWQLKTGTSLDAQPRVEKTAAPLTIYDLEQTELVQDGEERERMLIKALRELVK